MVNALDVIQGDYKFDSLIYNLDSLHYCFEEGIDNNLCADSEFKINFRGFVDIVNSIVSRNKFNKGFRVIYMSSVFSIKGTEKTCGYGASKSAADSAVRSLALKYANNDIYINSLLVGLINEYDKKGLYSYVFTEEEYSYLKMKQCSLIYIIINNIIP